MTDAVLTPSPETEHHAKKRFLHPIPPAPPPSPLRWRDKWDTVTFVAFGIITALTRFIGLAAKTDNGTPLFDEKHHVPQVWQTLESTRDLIPSGTEDNPGYGLIVHPSVVKQIIALGERISGYSPTGWQFMPVVCGTLVILLLMDIVRRIPCGSRLAVGTTGLYALADGVLFVSPRVGTLDMTQTPFIIVVAWVLSINQVSARKRLEPATELGSSGLYLSYRWWRLLAGIVLGFATGVKWFGPYYITALGLWSVFTDLVPCKNIGADKPVLGTLVRDIAPALRDLVVASLGVCFLSWRLWFTERTSVYRHVSPEERDTGLPDTGRLPEAVQNYLRYRNSVLKSHAKLTTSNGHKHPWEPKPWEWLVSQRSMLCYSTEITCSGGQECKGWMMLSGTLPIWWLLVPVALWATWRWLGRRDGRYALPVIGFLASWLSWVIGYDHQMYFFYATVLIPFVLTAFAPLADDLSRWRPRDRPVGSATVGTYAALVVVAFMLWLPVLTGYPLPLNHSDWWFQLSFWSWSRCGGTPVTGNPEAAHHACAIAVGV